MKEKILIGWQKQPKKLNIQGEIEKAINTITRRRSSAKCFRENRRRSKRTSDK